jgi:hypothetical protein
MVRISVLNDCLNNIVNAERRGKRQVSFSSSNDWPAMKGKGEEFGIVFAGKRRLGREGCCAWADRKVSTYEGVHWRAKSMGEVSLRRRGVGELACTGQAR